MQTLVLPAQGLDLDATLTSGQSFSWRKAADQTWHGWIRGQPCCLRLENNFLYADAPGLTANHLTHYFSLDVSIDEVLATFPAHDPWLEQAYAFAPGLRLLRQDPWETVCNFICSALKQVVQIEQINHDLRRTFGEQLPTGESTFPSPERLRLCTEQELRQCRLGFRARHLVKATEQIDSGEISLEKIVLLPTPEASIELCRLHGVGEKVAGCILLFAYNRWESFPIDVWVARALHRLYFSHCRKITFPELAAFAHYYFGPNRGYAQQFLFHWMRKEGHRYFKDNP